MSIADDVDFTPPPRDAAAEEALSLSASWTDLDVRIILSATEDDQQPQWRDQLPVPGTILNRVFDADGRQWWCVVLDSPVQHPIPGDAELSRYPAEYRGHDDEAGTFFFWAYVLLVASADADAPLLLGATGHRVDVAAVLDVSVREDPEIDPIKVDPVGQASADVGLSDGDTDDDQRDPAGGADQPAPSYTPAETTRVAHRPAATAGLTATETAAWIQGELQRHTDALRTLAGDIALSEIPLPQQLSPHTSPSDTHPQYIIGDTELRYRSRDPHGAYAWQSTIDPSELLYWCIDDIARSLAWRWAQRSPSFPALSPAVAQRALWAPYWQLLMTALNPQWGAATGRSLRGIL